MTIFYHVSTDLRHDGVFVPRIPSCRHKEQEDSVTPRISVAPTIEDCLTAIPNGGMHLDHLNIEQRGYFLIYRIDTEKLGISDSDIVTSETLYEKDLVRDAGMTNEYWITVPFVVPEEDIFMIRLTNWEETPEDILPYSIYAIADEKYEGDYLEAYMEEYQDYVPSSVRVYELDYIHEQVKEGDEVVLYFDFEEEREAIESYVKNHLKAEITHIGIDEITFEMKEDANLRNLFMHHANVAMVNF